MKIGYFADGPWAHKALEKIVTDSCFEIVFIVPRFDTQDPILKEWANKLGVPFLLAENVNSEQFIGVINQFGAELLVSMSFNQILKTPILCMAPKGFINCHAGALPFYRGRNPLNWVLINGESEFGITVHYIDEGIDTGDIIEQQKFPIEGVDNYSTLLSKAINSCADVLYSALKKLATNTVERIRQQDIHPIGTYFCQRVIGDEELTFNQSAVRVHNFIRAITLPGPGARCFHGDQEYAILSSELILGAPEYIATIGEVTARNSKGCVVKVADSSILITQMSEVFDGKVAEKFTPDFRVGTRFKVGK
ncbi:formyl transferase [Pseudoalteromonas sp. MSK9-3]|uniref:methionyl-tRNA formyltransferase n=1 Tax=Pseudoalteromonas sp. MSK9-3 TaxID=1897633 RepID=UPI000E6C961E|nr:methionyl-tRNA formyltransferase [Pseudoalteromonas sp. MSK9-3]RJE77346.1 formyl transferase [Pseudoalteromonas sp. MSK9-3]